MFHIETHGPKSRQVNALVNKILIGLEKCNREKIENKINLRYNFISETEIKQLSQTYHCRFHWVC